MKKKKNSVFIFVISREKRSFFENRLSCSPRRVKDLSGLERKWSKDLVIYYNLPVELANHLHYAKHTQLGDFNNQAQFRSVFNDIGYVLDA